MKQSEIDRREQERVGFQWWFTTHSSGDLLQDYLQLAEDDGSWFEQLYGRQELMTAQWVWDNAYAPDRRYAIRHLIKTEGHPFYLKFKDVWFKEYTDRAEYRKTKPHYW